MKAKSETEREGTRETGGKVYFCIHSSEGYDPH